MSKWFVAVVTFNMYLQISNELIKLQTKAQFGFELLLTYQQFSFTFFSSKQRYFHKIKGEIQLIDTLIMNQVLLVNWSMPDELTIQWQNK